MCLWTETRYQISPSYVTVRLNDIYVFLCQYRRANMMVDVSVNNVLYFTCSDDAISTQCMPNPTQKHIKQSWIYVFTPREQSFWFEGSDLKNHFSRFPTPPSVFFSTCYHHYVFFYISSAARKHYRGHRVTTGMRWLICPTQH